MEGRCGVQMLRNCATEHSRLWRERKQWRKSKIPAKRKLKNAGRGFLDSAERWRSDPCYSVGLRKGQLKVRGHLAFREGKCNPRERGMRHVLFSDG
jgi:hypothetical protein